MVGLIEERRNLVEFMGLEPEFVDLPAFVGGNPTIDTMIDSYSFFFDFDIDPVEIFKKETVLIVRDAETELVPILDFLTGTLEIKNSRLRYNQRLFKSSLKDLKQMYNTIEDEIGVFRAKKMFRDAPILLLLDSQNLIDRVDYLDRALIDFSRNYSLLGRRPHEVIESRNYMRYGLHISENGAGKWYYMLIGVSKENLKDKVKYCEGRGIEWRVTPKVLLLGMGTAEKPGALVRRSNMIDIAFPRGPPEVLDYKANPQCITDTNDIRLKERIELYVK